jgi:hypothetical protein
MIVVVLLVLVFLAVSKEFAARDVEVRREREARETRHFYETMLSRERTDSDERYQLVLARQREERNHLIEQIREAEERAARERARLTDRLIALTSPRALDTVSRAEEHARAVRQFDEVRDRLEERADPLREYEDPETHEIAIPVGLG